jgi:hypothetical protein
MEKLPQAKSKHSIISELRGAFKTGLKRQVHDRKKIVLREKKEIGGPNFRKHCGSENPEKPLPDPQFISALQRFRRETLRPTEI